MTPAKVITSEGKVFFVPTSKDIIEGDRLKDIPLKAQEDLKETSIVGTRYGFKTVAVRTGKNKEFFHANGEVRKWSERGAIIRGRDWKLRLRDGTTIEPVTEEGMKHYIKHVERR